MLVGLGGVAAGDRGEDRGAQTSSRSAELSGPARAAAGTPAASAHALVDAANHRCAEATEARRSAAGHRAGSGARAAGGRGF
jgi:hypothetical protein